MRCISLKRFLIWKKVKFQQLWHLISCRFLARNPVPAEQLASSSCSPIREVSAWLSSSLVNIGMFLLNSFGTPNYLHWPCFPALQRLKEKAWDSVRSNALSLYCFPSVGSVFRIYMYSSLREWWGSYKCGKKSWMRLHQWRLWEHFHAWQGHKLSCRWAGWGLRAASALFFVRMCAPFVILGGPMKYWVAERRSSPIWSIWSQCSSHGGKASQVP